VKNLNWKQPTAFVALLTWLCVPALAESALPQFSDAIPQSGIKFKNVCGDPPGEKGWINESMGAGAAWLDYDQDGNLDLYLINGSTYDRKPGQGEPNRLFRGDGKGRFTDVTQQAGVGDRGWGYGVAVGDIDNDGYPDIYVTNVSTNVLYHNQRDGTFKDITTKAGVAHLPLWSTSAAFVDVDSDGLLDLYVDNYMVHEPGKVPRRASREALESLCTYAGIPVFCGPLGQIPLQDVLYHNNGDNTFSDVTRQSGLWLVNPRYALGLATGDFDNDGDQDLYIANDSLQNSLWQNRGDGTFVDVGVGSLAGLNAAGKPQAGMGTYFGDYTGDGWLDIIVTNFAEDLNTLYRNMNGKFFMDDSLLSGTGMTRMNLSWGTGFCDFDHDGDSDLFIANGHIYPQVADHQVGTEYHQHNHLFVNEGGRFTERSKDAGPAFEIERSFRSAAFGDYDNDGDVDVLVTSLDDAPLLMRNDGPTAHYLQIRLIGSKSNRDAVGARVILVAGGKGQLRERTGGGSYLAAHDPRLHFGLGQATRAEMIEVRWPSGHKEVFRDVAGDRTITIVEGEGIQ